MYEGERDSKESPRHSQGVFDDCSGYGEGRGCMVDAFTYTHQEGMGIFSSFKYINLTWNETKIFNITCAHSLLLSREISHARPEVTHGLHSLSRIYSHYFFMYGLI